MAFTKEQKKKILEELREDIDKNKSIVFADFKGLKNKAIFDLRTDLKDKDSKLKIVKKTLLKIAFKEKGIDINENELQGQLCLVFGYNDPLLPIKTVYNLSKQNENLKILGAIFENQFINKEKVVELAKTPGRLELLSMLVNSISTPVSSFVNVLEANIKCLVFSLGQIKNK